MEADVAFNVLELSPEGVLVVDRHGVVAFANRMAHELLGAGAQAWRWLDGRVFRPDGTPVLVDDLPIARALCGEVVTDSEMVVERDDMTRVHTLERAHPIADLGAVAFIQDLTGWRMEERRIRRELRAAIDVDPLTGAATRAAICAVTERLLKKECGTHAALMIDLDDFKPINDEHGHAAGDEVLIAVAGRLRSAVRTHDVTARWGGDEFAVLLEDIGGGLDIEIASRRIREALSERVTVCERVPVAVSACIGVAMVFPGEDETVSSWWARADAAMYVAKKSGKGRVHIAR